MDPGAVLLALLGIAEPRLAPRRSSSSTTRPSRRTPSRVPGTARRSSASRARRRRSSPRPMRTQAVGALDPWLGAALSVAEATRNVVDHRRAAARRHELPELRRPDAARGVLAAERGRPRPRRRVPRARPAGHRRQRLALQRVAGAGAIAPTPEIGVVGLLDDVALARRPGVRGGRRRDRCSSARRCRASRAASTRRSPGIAAEDGPPALDLAREAALQAFVREAAARGLLALGPGRVAAAGSPSRSPRRAIWADAIAGSARRSGCRSRARRRSTCSARARSRLVVTRRPRHAPALTLLARQHGLRGRGARARSAATGSSSSSPARARPAPPRSAAAASPTRSTSRSTTSATPGTRAAAGARLGERLRCAACSGRSSRAGAARRRRRSPRSGCSRSSIAARSRPASRSATASS